VFVEGGVAGSTAKAAPLAKLLLLTNHTAAAAALLCHRRLLRVVLPALLPRLRRWPSCYLSPTTLLLLLYCVAGVC
jgi:hypothetical protein